VPISLGTLGPHGHPEKLCQLSLTRLVLPCITIGQGK
jgi:hypothetical protein